MQIQTKWAAPEVPQQDRLRDATARTAAVAGVPEGALGPGSSSWPPGHRWEAQQQDTVPGGGVGGSVYQTIAPARSAV